MSTGSPRQLHGWFAATRFRAEREVIGRDVHLLRLSGDLDFDSSETAIDVIRDGISPRARMVLLDLSGVTFCSSSGLRVLIVAARHAADRDVDLGLVGAGRPVLRPMEITGLDARFRSYPTIAAALADRVPGSGDPTDS